MTIRIKNFLTLTGILILFICPLIIAWGLYQNKSYKPTTMNSGSLINPPQALKNLQLYSSDGLILDQKSFKSKWVLVYVNPGPCTATCEKNLYYLRQVGTALGKNRNRVIRVFITTVQTRSMLGILTKMNQDTLILIAKQNTLNQFFQLLKSKNQFSSVGNFYVVDPLGNLIMSYPAIQNPRGIYNDLQRLLLVSQIG